MVSVSKPTLRNYRNTSTVEFSLIPFSRLIGRPSSVIFRLSELAHRVEECAQQEEEAEDLPEVKKNTKLTISYSARKLESD